MTARNLLIALILLLFPAHSRAADATTLAGKVLCGYQGWFNCKGDGAKVGWRHWSKSVSKFTPSTVSVDMWPDMSEYPPSERFKTGFTNRNGSAAEVFSSHRADTVRRHFRWMREYGIDGAIVQRFAVELEDPVFRRLRTTILNHCRTAAEKEDRVFSLMYDLSGLGANRMRQIERDWSALHAITNSSSYLLHQGKPLIGIWGVGFSDERKYGLGECRKLIEFFKRANCSVLLGVPTHWRRLKEDALADTELHEIMKLADMISPWTIGRYPDPTAIAERWIPQLNNDIAWCRAESLEYLPVVYPGFSWRNLRGGPLGVIPRRRGEFLWSQFTAAKRAGASMVYVAMFDEVDEATAIFKCTDTPPTAGQVRFLDNEGLPSDHYLRVTGAGGRLIRGDVSVGIPLPQALGNSVD